MACILFLPLRAWPLRALPELPAPLVAPPARPRRPALNKQNAFPSECEPSCPPFYVATRSYTARCPEGTTGPVPSFTVTRTCQSPYSVEDAARRARDCAKAEATAELQCFFEATACVVPVCGTVIHDQVCATRRSVVSQAEADAEAEAAAAEMAQAICNG